MEVAETVAGRVAQFAVGIRDPLENLVRDAHILMVVERRTPEAQDLRPHLLDHLLRLDDIALRLRHLLAVAIDRPAIGDHRPVGCSALDLQSNHQRGVEPSPELIASLEVDIGWIRQSVRWQHRLRT